MMDSAAAPNFPILDPAPESRAAGGDAQFFALHELMQAVARQTDLRATLALVAEKARTLAHADSAALTLLDPTRTLLDFAAVAGTDAEQIIGQTVRVEDALAGQTALTGELYLAHHPAHSQPLLATLDPAQARGWGVRSAVVVPIYLHGRPAGAIAALNRADDAGFSGADVLRLQILANAAALALSADGLKRQAAQKQRERDILYQAARTASSSLNVQEVLSNVLSTVASALEMAAGAVFLLNDERTRLYIGADAGLDGDDHDRQLPGDGSGPAARALQSGQPVRIADTLQNDLDDLPLPGMRSLLLAPMVARAMPEGLIVIGSRQANAYSPEDSALLSAVASQAAVALENAWLYEDATRRAQEATALYELSQTVGATLQLNRALHFVADSVLALLHVDKFALFLYDPPTGTLPIKIARNIRRETVQTMRPKLGEGIAGWVAEFETPTAVQDVAADHRNRSCPIDTEGVTSLVSVPLQSREQVIGVLHAMSSRRRLFTVSEMELLYTIANQVGASIANAQMYEEARQQSDEIRKGVRRVARALGSSLNPSETAQVIADLAAEMTGSDRSILYAADAQGELSVRAASNFRAALAPRALEKTPETPAAWVARRGRSLTIEDFGRDARFALPLFAQREKIGSYLGVPLKLGRDVLGVLEVYGREPRRYRPDEMRLLITFASQASVALQNALLVEQAGRRVADLDAALALSAHLCASGSLTEGVQEALARLGAATLADAVQLELPAPLVSAVWQRPGTENATGNENAGRADAPIFSLPVAVSSDAPGALHLTRAPGSAPFSADDERLAQLAANLLCLRLRAPLPQIPR